MSTMTNEAIHLYINKCKLYVDFMLSQQQWSGLTKAEIENWLSNFCDLEISESYLVYKLLTHIIYYSEKDVLDALREGINSRLFYDVIIAKQVETDFSLSQHALSSIIKTELHNSRFIPLLDSNAPHESANYLSRLLVQQGLIQPTHSIFLNALGDAYRNETFKNLVIVDDCVGSGDQLRNFWNSANVSFDGKDIPLGTFCSNNHINVYYLTLFGYDQSIRALTEELSCLKICCVRSLSDSQRVFSEKSYIWTDEDERRKALDLFSDLTTKNGIYLYGYKKLDFAFIMHQTIPDWSLPIFWQENANWKLLMRRKNSND